jgi:membrane protein YqaA with SNARE-associated domain
MNFLSPESAKHTALQGHGTVLPTWLTRLGAPGLFFVAVMDSSIIPLPLPGSTDLLLLWLVAHSGNPWLLTSMAISGSIVGGYTTWDAGRRGGEAALNRHVPKRILKRVVSWVKNHPMLSVFVPAVLPPPIPLLPFAIASGALGVTRKRFLIIYGAARTLRYSLIAWVAVVYGRRVIRMWSGTLEKWSAPLLWVFGGLLLVGVCFGIWKIRSPRKSAVPLKRASRINSVATE